MCLKCRSDAKITEEIAKKKTNSIRILQWNVRGIRSKLAEVQLLLDENEVDVACLQETGSRQKISV